MPKISDTANPLKIGSSSMKNAPSIAASAVSTIGLARTAPARITACASSLPAASSTLMKSTSKIEFRTMIPASAIMPIIEVAVNCAPSRAWPGMMPISVSGIGAMMISGTA